MYCSANEAPAQLSEDPTKCHIARAKLYLMHFAFRFSSVCLSLPSSKPVPYRGKLLRIVPEVQRACLWVRLQSSNLLCMDYRMLT